MPSDAGPAGPRPATVEVPEVPGALSAAWLQVAIGAHHPGAEVAGFTVAENTTGVTMRQRVVLRYARGTGPASAFVKSTVESHDGELFGANEARLYASGCALPIEMPSCYAAGVGGDGASVVVLEDLSVRGAEMNLAIRPLAADTAASGLEGLARLHGTHWGGGARPELAWIAPFNYALLARTAERKVGLVFDRADEHGLVDLLPAPLRDRRTLAARYGIPPAPGPRTVVHGDPHVGNTYTLPDGTLGFLDWQLVSRSSWEHDVGYFLIGSVAVDERRREERALLEHYRDALSLAGGERPSPSEMWERYRQTAVYGLVVWLITAAATTAHLREVCATCVQRFAAAVEDFGLDGMARS